MQFNNANVQSVMQQPNQSPNYGNAPLMKVGVTYGTPNEAMNLQNNMPISSQPKAQNGQVIPNHVPKNEVITNAVNGFTRLPDTQEQAVEMAKMLSKSQMLPPELRSTDLVDRTADVFLLLSTGASYGMSVAQTLRNFFVIGGKTGTSKIGLYVSTKAGLCIKAGEWDVKLEYIEGLPTATAWGFRYDKATQVKTIVYTAHDASLKGKMLLKSNTWIGVSTWSDKWPDMLKTRALGRLLDALFPDIIGGLASEELIEDVEYTEIEAPKDNTITKANNLVKDLKKGKKSEVANTYQLEQVKDNTNNSNEEIPF